LISIGDLVKAEEFLKVPYDPVEGLGIVVDIEPWNDHHICVVYFFQTAAIRWFEEEDLILVNSIQENKKIL
jgi:hypothetical protein